MDWGQHISVISSKAIKTLDFLCRNMSFAPWSTKEVAYKTLVQPKLEYAAQNWSPYSEFQITQIKKVHKTAARWTCRRLPNTSSVSKMLVGLEWPSLEARRDQSSLLLFHKIHWGAVSIEKDKYMTPAHCSKTIRSSHCAQYCRYQTYSDKEESPPPPPPPSGFQYSVSGNVQRRLKYNKAVFTYKAMNNWKPSILRIYWSQ